MLVFVQQSESVRHRHISTLFNIKTNFKTKVHLTSKPIIPILWMKTLSWENLITRPPLITLQSWDAKPGPFPITWPCCLLHWPSFWRWSGYGSVPLSSVQASVSLGIQCLPSSSADSQMLRADAPAPQELSSYACAGSRPSCHHPIKNPLKRNLSESGYLKSRRNLTRGISVPKSIHSPYRALDLLPGI